MEISDYSNIKNKYKGIGEWIKQHRKNLGITQQQLGNIIGVTRQYVSNLEREGYIKGPTDNIIISLQDVFNDNKYIGSSKCNVIEGSTLTPIIRLLKESDITDKDISNIYNIIKIYLSK